ncbi:CHAD domain-containing protein [Methylophaga sp. OBS4]|uniref:CHAD domain-containing protein n=1 Tax=Methylophaga sp. OBS4 TaxID=2991935 RepID=UPI002251D6C4|nr:CHAD domain-containing protein [Methylophaga sp. OBS4]MCX4186721.1 CHAD domain-containing protein [Methylophaga sp. OBS4]
MSKVSIPTKASAASALRIILLQEIAHIKKWRKVAIKGKDPEGVHQLRVSLRRMRTALEIFSPVLQKEYRRSWRAKLNFFAKELDAARDLDVFLLSHFAGKTNQSSLHHELSSQQQTAYQRLAKLLKSKHFNKPVRKLKKQLKHKQWAERHCRHPHQKLNRLANQRLSVLYENVLEQGKGLDLKDENTLHQLRIACKKLRYGSEFLHPVLDAELNRQFTAALKQLQNTLGEIHDAYVQKQMQHNLSETATGTDAASELEQILQTSERNSQAMKTRLIEDLNAFSRMECPWRQDK